VRACRSCCRRWTPTSSKIDAAALRSGKTPHHENEVTRPDCSKFWLGRSIRPLFDVEGIMTHSVFLGADITAKRDEMRKKQELQDKLVAEMRERERIAIELQLAQKLESVPLFPSSGSAGSGITA
jgi:hypothetical protein